MYWSCPKKIGNRLRNFKKNVKGLGGRGRLTNNIFDNLQNYYGMAIRQNIADLNAMKSATAASLFHVASSTTNDFHTPCRSGSDSWRLFKVDKVNNTSTYKRGPGLLMDIMKVIKPIYQELCSERLLKECSLGPIQNQSEMFHGMIWRRVPNHTYVGQKAFGTSEHDVVSHFNIGNIAALKLFKYLGSEPETYATLQSWKKYLRQTLVFM